MNIRVKAILLCLCSLLTLSGCLSTRGALSLAEPHAVHDRYTLIERTSQSVFGCRYDYRVYLPINANSDTSVILGHGFLRDQDNMIGLSRELANTGVRVVTLDFCNMRPWNGHHARNAKDMRDLAQALDLDDDVVYAGFSAGALAAVLASDSDTKAIVTLDLVDQDNLGLNAITLLKVPLIGLSGPAASCNANGNAEAIFNSRPDNVHTELTEVAGASHCEFETPSNWLCEVACGDDDGAQADKLETDKIVRLIVKKLAPFLSQTRG